VRGPDGVRGHCRAGTTPLEVGGGHDALGGWRGKIFLMIFYDFVTNRFVNPIEFMCCENYLLM
jgi:hypothetical protein